MADRKITLVAKDGEHIAISSSAALHIDMISATEHTNEEHIPDDFPIYNVSSSTLQRVVEFCEHNVTEPMTHIPHQASKSLGKIKVL